MARHTQDSSHLLGRCLASAANAGPALTPPPFLACCVCWAKRTTVDHVLIWWLDIFPAVARHYTNSRRRVLNRCYFSVGSASSIVDQRWTNSKIIFFPQQAQGVESLWRWFGVVDSGPALNRRCFHRLVSGGSCIVNCDTIPHSQKTGDAGMVLVQCRASVYGPTMIWYCDSVSRSLSTSFFFFCEHDCVSNSHWADVDSLFFYNESATASMNVLLNEQFIYW